MLATSFNAYLITPYHLFCSFGNKILLQTSFGCLKLLKENCIQVRDSRSANYQKPQVSDFGTTLIFLSFRTDRSGQTVQTQIRLRSSLVRVYTVCHSVCIVWTHYSMVEPHSSNFRVITTKFLGVRIFRKFTVLVASSRNSVLTTALLAVGAVAQ